MADATQDGERTATGAANAAARPAGAMRTIWRRPLARAGLVAIAVYGAAAVYGEAVYRWHRAADRTPPYQRGALEEAYRAPSLAGGHWLGTDGLGRDVARRLVQGARAAFHVGIVTSLIAIPIGVVLGLLGGYFGGRVDDAVVWLYTTVASVPGLLLALSIAMVVGRGLAGVCWGIGLTTWVGLCRLIRGETMKHRGREYVLAARVIGAGHGRILFRHILPNVAHLAIVVFTLRFPASVGTEVFMSFLGVGVQGEPSWGTMIQSARMRLWHGAWWEMTAVTVAIFGLVLAFHVVGDALRDALDPRTQAALAGGRPARGARTAGAAS
jgi:peptide/nickel transport system permease protein